MKTALRRLLGLLSLALYLASCFAPSVQHPNRGESPALRNPHPGYMALFLGWIPPVTVPWSANLLVLAGWLCLLSRKHDAAFYLGTAALVAALTALPMVGFAGLMVGYYLWLASFLVFMVFAYLEGENEPR